MCFRIRRELYSDRVIKHFRHGGSEVHPGYSHLWTALEIWNLFRLIRDTQNHLRFKHAACVWFERTGRWSEATFLPDILTTLVFHVLCWRCLCDIVLSGACQHVTHVWLRTVPPVYHVLSGKLPNKACRLSQRAAWRGLRLVFACDDVTRLKKLGVERTEWRAGADDGGGASQLGWFYSHMYVHWNQVDLYQAGLNSAARKPRWETNWLLHSRYNQACDDTTCFYRYVSSALKYFFSPSVEERWKLERGATSDAGAEFDPICPELQNSWNSSWAEWLYLNWGGLDASAVSKTRWPRWATKTWRSCRLLMASNWMNFIRLEHFYKSHMNEQNVGFSDWAAVRSCKLGIY